MPYTRLVIRTVTATRYVTPLREGGSVPALVEADDDGLYVVKLLGAGHGRKALVAELLAGEIGRQLGLPVPDLVLVELDATLARAEPDQEIQDLLERSAGTNVGLDFLPGALAFSPAVGPAPEPDLAAAVVWLDALTTNVDRTRAQPEPDRLASAAAPDRPRVGALHPPHLARPRPPTRDARSSPSAITCCCRSPLRSPRPTSAWHRMLDRTVFERARGRSSPTTGCRPSPACPTPTRTAVPMSTTWSTRLEAPRAFVEEAERARAA